MNDKGILLREFDYKIRNYLAFDLCLVDLFWL